jgi:quercetin dioxygenase-like cupin family protein/ribosomal protein L40E
MNLDQAIEFYESNIKSLIEAANGERELDPVVWSTFEQIAMDCFALLADNIDNLKDFKGRFANKFFYERWQAYLQNDPGLPGDIQVTSTTPIVIKNVKYLQIPTRKGGRRQNFTYTPVKRHRRSTFSSRFISDFTIPNEDLEKLFYIIEKYTSWYESLKSKIGSWSQRNFPTFRGMMGMRENKKPYISNILNENLEIRGFYSDTPKNLLEWHRDEEDRTIMVEEGSGWYLQKDNDLPFKLQPGMFYQIPAGMYHRLLREANSSDLLLVIEKKKVDQNKDGKNDFDDVKIARMSASGMTKSEIEKKHPELFEEIKKMKCPRCGALNSPSAKKCKNCGLEMGKSWEGKSWTEV